LCKGENHDSDSDSDDEVAWGDVWETARDGAGAIATEMCSTLLRANLWTPLKLLFWKNPIGRPGYAERVAMGSLTTDESETLLRFLYRDWGGWGELGKQMVGDEEYQACTRADASPLYGEVLPAGVSTLLGDRFLAASIAAFERGVTRGAPTTLIDMGCGLGRIPIQAFWSVPNLGHAVGIEITPSRAQSGILALQRLYRLLVRDRVRATGSLKGLAYRQTATSFTIIMKQERGPERRLTLMEGSLFNLDPNLVRRADAVVLATDFREPHQLVRLRGVMDLLPGGARVLTYKNLAEIYPYFEHDAPRHWMRIAEGDKYPTSWSPRGYHFHLSIKVSATSFQFDVKRPDVKRPRESEPSRDFERSHLPSGIGKSGGLPALPSERKYGDTLSPPREDPRIVDARPPSRRGEAWLQVPGEPLAQRPLGRYSPWFSDEDLEPDFEDIGPPTPEWTRDFVQFDDEFALPPAATNAQWPHAPSPSQPAPASSVHATIQSHVALEGQAQSTGAAPVVSASASAPSASVFAPTAPAVSTQFDAKIGDAIGNGSHIAPPQIDSVVQSGGGHSEIGAALGLPFSGLVPADWMQLGGEHPRPYPQPYPRAHPQPHPQSLPSAAGRTPSPPPIPQPVDFSHLAFHAPDPFQLPF
jgi:hypothetical protein